ncbi:MAG: hypothetical protein H0V17_23585 [Deltaproteobacteria bacterium]|nr:hypothetical protein [Deltaproteobacteria bacterium]
MRTYLATLLFVVACGGDTELSTPQECNPLGGGESCMGPWPSGLYEVADATSVTGRRLAIPDNTLPINIDDITLDPAPYNVYDGFSSAAPMITAFETGIDASNLVTHDDLAASLTDVSPTVIIDMATGELVEHFAELDAPAAATPGQQALFIRPSKLLKRSTRYAVAIKKTLKAKDGGELPVPEGFRAIVDGEITTHRLLEAARPRFVDIFEVLAEHGIDKADLVTAWDFTTASGELVRSDLLEARDAALSAMGTDGANLNYQVIDGNAAIDEVLFARKINGEFDVPLFLTNNGSFAVTTKLQRDSSGKPITTGMYRAPFTAIIPKCAIDSLTPVPMIIYGHGLLGRAQDQVSSGGTRHASAGICAVVVGTDMRGMSDRDVANVALALNDGNNGHAIFDVLVQGMINHVALVQLSRGALASELFTKDGTPNTASIVDPTKFHYYGISQGGIMGTTVCAIDPVIEKCVVQVGAINYSLLLERSHDWPQYRTTLNGAYPSPLDSALMVNLMQLQWDRTEPTAVADVIVGEGFPNTPTKHVFMQVAIGDDEVANIASELQARTMGIPVMLPSPYIPQGIATSSTPVTSGMILYDFGVGDTIPDTNEPPPDNDVHSQIRNKQATIDMMKHFYDTGEIQMMCTAERGCDCAASGCGAQL